MVAAGLARRRSRLARSNPRGSQHSIRNPSPAIRPLTFLGVATLLAIGLCAGLIPALRAAAIDPMQTLRTE